MEKIVKIYLAVALLLGLQGLFQTSFGQTRITIQQAIDSTLNRNLQIKQAKLNALSTEQNYKQSKFNLLPNLNASPQASFNWGRTLDVSTYNYITQRVFLVSGNFSAQLTLFQGGLLRRQILQNKLLLQVDNSQIEKVKFDLVLAVITAYLQILTTQELSYAAKQQIQLAHLSIEQINKGVKAGNKSLADLAQAQSRLAFTEQDEASIQNQLEVAWLTLKQLMNMQDAKLEAVSPNIDDVGSIALLSDSVKIIERAIAASPDLRTANLQKDAAFQGVRVAKSSRYPSLYLFGSAGSNFSDARSLLTGSQQVGFDTIGRVNGTNQPVLSPAFRSTVRNYSFINQFADNFYQSAGITLQIPIFNRFTAQTNLRKTKINYQNAQVATELTISNLTKILSQAMADLRLSQKRRLVAEINFNATKQVLEISEKRYKAGLLNAIDYNTAVASYNKAEFDLIQSKYDLLFKRKIIDYYTGSGMSF